MSTATIEILRGELERLFSLEELTSMSQGLLGLDPAEVGGANAKGSFARALTERCFDGDRLEALVDVMVHARREVDPRVLNLPELLKEELAPGTEMGGFQVQKKLGESELGIVYLAQLGSEVHALKVLRRDAARDRSGVHRFLTANRLVATVHHDGLPKRLSAGELPNGAFYVSYEYVEAQSLAARLARTGPLHMNELKPVLRGILEPLAALHKAGLVHGDLKLENVLSARRLGGDTEPPRIVLIDFGTDRLRQRTVGSNGHTGLLAVYGSPKTIAPEIVRGRSADARADVYAFGAMLYELVCGKPVFECDSAADAAFAHLTQKVVPPGEKAPRGWVPKEVDTWVLSLLDKDPARRPRDASALFETLETMGRASAQLRAAKAILPERVTELSRAVLAAPRDAEAAIALEQAVEEGADPAQVAEAFAKAAEQVAPATEEAREAKTTLLYRAARTFESQAVDKARAEAVYAQILELNPGDDIASAALEEVRRALGKFDDIVEMLIGRSEQCEPGEDKARVFAEIGRLYSHELDDPEQALVAYTQALSENPTADDVAAEIERLCGGKNERWNDVLAAATEAVKGDALSSVDKNVLLGRIGRWYEHRVARADMALMAYQQILNTDPANERAAEGLAGIYRRAQQWPELVGILVARADVAASSPRARDLRTEAAEVLESKLNDSARAKEMYALVLAEDPGHLRAGDGLARIAERSGDFVTLAQVLERRAEARRGGERADALAKVAEVYEDHLNDLAEATRRYEAALAIDPTHIVSLKGLDRIYNRLGRYRELLETLERQVAVAATPRQKINLFERMAALHDEEFLDHERAASCLEQVLSIDPSNDFALTTLARHYRALGRWEEAVKTYEKHASVTHEETRRVELIMARARTLAEQVGSPERAMRAYEMVLQLVPAHAGALEALAQLRELSGDAHAALSAIEALAAKAATPELRAEQWMRAAKLLEARGDRDGAIERYKLALDANPRDPRAAAALRSAYAQRGDALSVVSLIEKELGSAEGDLAKARLFAELAKVQRGELRAPERAELAAKRALDLDGTNADALMVLGDLAFESGRMLEAAKFYESVVGRTSTLSKEDAIRVLVQFIEAAGKTSQPVLPAASRADLSGASGSLPIASGPLSGALSGATSARSPGSSSQVQVVAPLSNPRMTTAVEALQKLAPSDPQAMARVARVVLESGDARSAYGMLQEVLDKHGRSLSASDRAHALYYLGESARRMGEPDRAIAPLRESAAAEPANPAPFQSLAKIYEERGNWEEVVRIKRQRLEVAPAGERFDLLLEIGDLEFNKLSDRTRAQKTYAAALEERPDDRKLLTRLMQLYSEEKDWAKLVEVVLRLADFVEEPKQRAKYMHTAAIVSSRQLHAVDQAIEFYERALEFDPDLVKAVDELVELCRQKKAYDKVEKFLNVRLEQAKHAEDRTLLPKLLDQLGELYHRHLGETELAIDAYEAAQAFDPDERQRAETLAELYATNPKQYLDKAVRAQAQILRRNPYRVESYKLLRKLYTDAKKADPAWCLCQALTVLNLAAPDEERFYLKHRADNAAPVQTPMNEDEWSKMAHWDLDPLLTRLFAVIEPSIVKARTQALAELGYDPRYAIDTSLHPYPISQTLHYAVSALGMRAPLVFQNTNDSSSLGFVHAQTPAIVLGRAAFEPNVPTQAMAFAAGRHLSYFRPGHYVRHLVPTGTGLKAWLFAAIKLCVPQFPVTPDLQGQVAEAMSLLGADFQGSNKDKLASLVSKLIQSGGAIDLKKWVAAIDFTADRAGLVLAHDLQLATEMIRATGVDSSRNLAEQQGQVGGLPVKERMKEIVQFAVSEEYFAMRDKLGISVG